MIIDASEAPSEELSASSSSTNPDPINPINTWTVFTHGSHNRYGTGVGCLIINPIGEKIVKPVRLGFVASNDEDEYEVVIYDLPTASSLGVTNVHLFTDSKLGANQCGGSYETKDYRIRAYLDVIQ